MAKFVIIIDGKLYGEPYLRTEKETRELLPYIEHYNPKAYRLTPASFKLKATPQAPVWPTKESVKGMKAAERKELAKALLKACKWGYFCDAMRGKGGGWSLKPIRLFGTRSPGPLRRNLKHDPSAEKRLFRALDLLGKPVQSSQGNPFYGPRKTLRYWFQD